MGVPPPASPGSKVATPAGIPVLIRAAWRLRERPRPDRSRVRRACCPRRACSVYVRQPRIQAHEFRSTGGCCCARKAVRLFTRDAYLLGSGVERSDTKRPELDKPGAFSFYTIVRPHIYVDDLRVTLYGFERRATRSRWRSQRRGPPRDPRREALATQAVRVRGGFDASTYDPSPEGHHAHWATGAE